MMYYMEYEIIENDGEILPAHFEVEDKAQFISMLESVLDFHSPVKVGINIWDGKGGPKYETYVFEKQ